MCWRFEKTSVDPELGVKQVRYANHASNQVSVLDGERELALWDRRIGENE